MWISVTDQVGQMHYVNLHNVASVSLESRRSDATRTIVPVAVLLLTVALPGGSRTIRCEGTQAHVVFEAVEALGLRVGGMPPPGRWGLWSRMWQGITAPLRRTPSTRRRAA